MKKRNRRTIFLYAGVILSIFAVVTAIGIGLRSEMIRIRQREAKNVLFYYNEKIVLQLQGTMNDAGALAETALVAGQSGRNGLSMRPNPFWHGKKYILPAFLREINW